jgi:hypothetical protein
LLKIELIYQIYYLGNIYQQAKAMSSSQAMSAAQAMSSAQAQAMSTAQAKKGKKSKEDTKNCSICDEKFNKSTHIPIICKGCPIDDGILACKKCVKQYMLTSINPQPACMNCHTEWSDEFIAESIDRSFISKEYKLHLAEILLEREMSKMPATMEFAEQQKQIDLVSVQMNKANVVLFEYRRKIREIEDEIRNYHREISRIRVGGVGSSKKAEKKEYDIKCPNPQDCRGIMSRNKCGLCNLKTCSACMEIMGYNEEEIALHECKPENVESAKLIRKESKPCPKCGIPICKIDGCDQMWCPAEGCDTAFSWRTGEVDLGRRHNPHYYQRQRELAEKNGTGVIAREPGDVVCGGMPDYRQIKTQILDKIYPNKEILEKYTETEFKAFKDNISEIHRIVAHITHVNLAEARAIVRRTGDIRESRISYLLGKISKDELKAVAIKTNKTNLKNRKIMELYEILADVGRDMFSSLIISKNKSNVMAFIKEISEKVTEYIQLREYCNKEFAKIGLTYNLMVPFMDDKWKQKNKKYKKSNFVNGVFAPEVGEPEIGANEVVVA